MLEIIGTIMFIIGSLGILILIGIGAFQIDFILGLIYMFVLIIIFGAIMVSACFW